MRRTTVTLDEGLVEEIEGRYGPVELLNFSAVLRRLLRKGMTVEESS